MTDDANKMWGGRFAAGPDAIMEAINASIGFDQRLAHQDIEGSRAHAAMLAATGILSDSDAEAIREGLLTVLSEIEEGAFQFSTALEDIHMNVEARSERGDWRTCGAVAHGPVAERSGGDGFPAVGARSVRCRHFAGIEALQRALLGQAEAGADWVMPGFTHLQTAQPVTWGHHMMAYVEMLDARCRTVCRCAGADERKPPGRGGFGGHVFSD